MLHLERGLEALNSNLALSSCIQRGLERSCVAPDGGTSSGEERSRGRL